jgi:hypothetical protein
VHILGEMKLSLLGFVCVGVLGLAFEDNVNNPPVGTVYAPLAPGTPLSAGMNAPGTLSVNESTGFDEVMWVDDVDDYLKNVFGLQSQVAIGNPDGDIFIVPSEPNEVRSGTFVNRVQSSVQGGKRTFTYRFTSRPVDSTIMTIDRYLAKDMTDSNPLSGPGHLVYDNNTVSFSVMVEVKNVP